MPSGDKPRVSIQEDGVRTPVHTRKGKHDRNRPRADDYHGPVKTFVELGEFLGQIAYGKWFELIVLFAIVLASMVLALQTYDAFADDKVLVVIEEIVFYIFVTELVMKILSESVRPWKYFIGKSWQWNCFDFAIVLVGVLPLGGNVTSLRMVRLLRLTKMIKHAPRLKVLMAGLWGGTGQIAYISILIALIQYLYAIIGVVLFSENDPDHYSSLYRAMVTLLRVATLEDWTDVFYINYFGCDLYSNNERYVTGNSSTMIAVDQVLCDQPQAQPGASTFYFFSFTMIASLIMLSMFIGAITISMEARVRKMQEKAKKKADLKRMTSAVVRNQSSKKTADNSF